MDSLRRLPLGAVYTSSSDGLRLTLGLQGDSLHVTAEAEGPPRLEYREEESLGHIQSEQSKTETVKEPAALPFWGGFKQALIGVLIAFILAIIIKRYKSNGRR